MLLIGLFAYCNIIIDMKKLLFALTLLLSGQIWAQSNLTVFAEEGEKFIIFLNGVQQNKTAQANVHVENINDNVQKLRLVFDDKSLASITQNLYYEPHKEYTCVVVQKKKNQVKRIDGKNTPAVYVIRLQDVKDIDPNAVKKTDKIVLPDNINSNDINTNEMVTDKTTITTTTITPANKGENVNVNVGANGVGINMNITGIEGERVSNTSTTTTTTTTRSTSNNQVAHVDHQKHKAKPATPVCAPMSPTTMGSVLDQIKKQSFEDNKLNVIKQVLASNCISAAQVKQLMGEFKFDENKLKVAKMCYEKTTDKNNYFTLNDAFSFSSTADELNTFLQSKGAVIDSGE